LWHEDPEWTRALEDFQELRIEGVSGVTLDLTKLEDFIYNDATFRLIDYVLQAENSDDPDGRRYVPRLMMAYFMHAFTAAGAEPREA
jgi:hypothetical protein